MKRINPSMENGMKAGAVVIGVILVGVALMAMFPSMTSKWSVWGPLLVCAGTAGGYFVAPFIFTAASQGWRWRYAMVRDRWKTENKVKIAWVMHQPLVLITAWGFLGPVFGSTLIVFPVTLAIYNLAGLILGDVLGGDDEDAGVTWIRWTTRLCLLASAYLIWVNGIYAVQHGGIDMDDPEPRMNAIGPIASRLGIAIPAGGGDEPDYDPDSPYTLAQMPDDDWRTSFDPKTGEFSVRVAPGKPAFLPVRKMYENMKIFSDRKPAFRTTSWKGQVEYYEGGELVKKKAKDAPVYLALVRFIPDGKGGYDREVFRKADTRPALWDVRPGQCDVLCQRQVFPHGKELAVCYAIDCDGRGAGWIEFKGAIKMAFKNECP